MNPDQQLDTLSSHLDVDMNLQQASEHLPTDMDVAVPVLRAGTIVGVVSRRIVQERAAQQGLAAGGLALSEVMLTDNAWGYVDEPFEELRRRLYTLGFDRLPVCDRTGRLVGMLAPDAHRGVDTRHTGATDVQSAADPIEYAQAPVDVASEESFPASDPPPPPSIVGDS